MIEASVRRVLLARACEDADPAGSFVSHAARARASRAAADTLRSGTAESRSDAERYLEGRADRLLGEVRREHPALASFEHVAGLLPPVGVVGVLGLALGFGLDALGSARQVNLLSFPLLGVLAWNFFVFTLQGVAGLVPKPAKVSPPWLLGGWQAVRRSLMRLGGAGDTAFASRVAARFGSLWIDAAGPLEVARGRVRLHVGAACFALGVVLGLYVAGFAFAYEATWESTFLDPPDVRRFLGFVLGPASSVLALPLPDVAGIAALQAPGSGEAAPWVHRWALTALLFVGLPRLLLAGHQAARVRRLSGGLRIDLDAAPFARLLAAFRGEGADVRVLSYSVELKPAAAARLHELLHELFGGRAEFGFEAPLAYGDGPPALGVRAPRATVVIFHLAQSPEREVHGVFVEELRAQISPDAESSLLLVLDETRYREVASPERLDERRRVWARVLAEVGARAVALDPGAEPAELLEAARAALGGKPELPA